MFKWLRPKHEPPWPKMPFWGWYRGILLSRWHRFLEFIHQKKRYLCGCCNGHGLIFVGVEPNIIKRCPACKGKKIIYKK